MNFNEAHDKFIKYHLSKRSGERRGRLQRGHMEAEQLFCRNVWWPLRNQFDNLHPEYEVVDWRGLSYFCDFAWITDSVKLIIEIKGFGPHVQDMDRKKYCNEQNRETFLTAMGYEVIAFAYDDVAHRPELCITLLRMVINRFQTDEAPVTIDSLLEREIVRLAHTLARPLRPIDVQRYLQVNHRTAVSKLRSLCENGWFTAAAGEGGKHIVKYELRRKGAHPAL
ncbi:MAG: hypothetical protein K0R75_679 [Paenibacillaceae bacterium]|nr:hypothetical protein [Paenibacillaceae bacterium]